MKSLSKLSQFRDFEDVLGMDIDVMVLFRHWGGDGEMGICHIPELYYVQ